MYYNVRSTSRSLFQILLVPRRSSIFHKIGIFSKLTNLTNRRLSISVLRYIRIISFRMSSSIKRFLAALTCCLAVSILQVFTFVWCNYNSIIYRQREVTSKTFIKTWLMDLRSTGTYIHTCIHALVQYSIIIEHDCISNWSHWILIA